MNYTQNFISLDEENYKIIPLNWGGVKYHNISFKGWKPDSMNASCEIFSELITVASETLKVLINMYKESHAFTQPEFYWKPDGDGCFGIKIGLLEIEIYKERMDKCKISQYIFQRWKPDSMNTSCENEK